MDRLVVVEEIEAIGDGTPENPRRPMVEVGDWSAVDRGIDLPKPFLVFLHQQLRRPGMT